MEKQLKNIIYHHGKSIVFFFIGVEYINFNPINGT